MEYGEVYLIVSTFRKCTGTILSNGLPVSSVDVYLYSTGTTDKIDLFSDSGGVTPISNPLVSDSSGRYACFFDVAANATFRIYLEKAGVSFTEENADLDGVSLPGTGPDDWSAYPATQNVNMAGYDITDLDQGIADNHIVTIDGTTNQPVDDDYAKFTANGLEGRSASEAFGDIKQAASDTATGVVERATSVETKTATDTTRYAALDDLGRTYTQKEIIAKGAGYWFDGVNDNINVADDADANITTNDFSILAVCTPHKLAGAGLLGKYEDAADNWRYEFLADGKFWLYVKVGNVESGIYSTTNVIYAVDDLRAIGFVSDRDGTKGQFYVDGVAAATTESIAMTTASLTNTGLLYVGRAAATHARSTVHRVLLFNLAVTPAEMGALSSGAPVPFKYIGASQASEVTGDDSDFDTVGNWLAQGAATLTGGFDSGDGGHDKCLRIEAGDASYEAAKLDPANFASGGWATGKTYRLTLDYKWINAPTTDTPIFTDGSGVSSSFDDLDKDASGWTAYNSESVIVSAADVFYIYVNFSAGGHADNELLIDNVILTQIGCVLQLESDSIMHNQWLDKSGNTLNGETSGALPINLDANHIERLEYTIATNTTITPGIPAGYKIDSITVQETTGNAITGGLNIGTSEWAKDIVDTEAIAGSALVDECTLLDTVFSMTASQAISFSAETNWNSASINVYIRAVRLK